MKLPLIVFSHLRWDFVYQRPQQLLSRLASHYEIYFFEEPVFHDGPPRLEIKEPVPGVLVCRPMTSVRATGFHDDQLPLAQELLEELVETHQIVAPVVWLYTPMAVPLIQQLKPRAIVYDCMDELSAFANAPKQLLQRENALLKAATVVFTGGPSLYRSKQPRHDAVHCFPSSVDSVHFGSAADSDLEHPLQQSIPRPRLGFYGVIDERLDLDLIASVADAHTEWQIVLVGPVVNKVDASRLPQRANIHYLGQQSYEDLPKFLAGWDVCLLPFALNEATRFISPTKTLEYMAAGKPIVSTPITDVAVPYGHVVAIADDAASFIEACEAALVESPRARRRRETKMREAVAATSWDQTVANMHAIISEAIGAKVTDEPHRTAWAPPTDKVYSAVILGAGPTGLSAAYHLGEDSLLLEQHETVGGWCRSITDNGFTFDYAGHIMFSNEPYVHELYKVLLGDNVHWQDREAWIFSNGVHTRYPFQGALYGLPPDVLTECIVGAIEARFGALKAPAAGASAAAAAPPGSSASACKAESITDCCGDGIAESTAPLGVAAMRRDGAQEPRNFEEFIYKVWGRGVAKHFALPYNRKLWAVPLNEMETSWLGGRVPMPDLEQMIQGALRPQPKPMGPNSRFGYPLKGGFQALMDGFLPHLRGELSLGARVTKIDPSAHEVVLSNGLTYSYEQLISTLPLPALIAMIGDEAPEYVHEAAARLRHVSVRCVNLGIARENVTEKHWIYYPGDSVFHRIFVQGNASPHCNPPGGFGITCEITYSPHKPLPCEGEALIDRCISDCIKVGLLRPDDAIIARNQVDMPYAYVVYDHGRAANVETIRAWLRTQDIQLAGRYSEWEYYNSDHAFVAGQRAAESVAARLKSRAPRGAARAKEGKAVAFGSV